MTSCVVISELRIGELRDRVREIESEDGLRTWSRMLLGDSRSGVRQLGEQCERRVARRVAERRHLEKLLVRREELRVNGFQLVAGVDEVGVGPLAGPVVAAAVVLPERVQIYGLNDSKQLSKQARERLAGEIREQCVGIGIGSVEPGEIDRLNIYRAALEAMRRAVEELCKTCEIDYLLVDARTVPGMMLPQTAIIHGDAVDASIAAASIVAKVHRDLLMVDYDDVHRGYGFSRHMGYGTEAHLRALRELGPSPIHRRSFAPVAAAERG